MALSLAARDTRQPFTTAECRGGHKYIEAIVTFDNSYAEAPGEVVDLSGRGFSTVTAMEILQHDPDFDTGYTFSFVPGASGDPATGVIIVYDEDNTSGIAAEVAAMTDLSTLNAFHVRFSGT